MPTTRRAVHVWLRAASGFVLTGALAACEVGDGEPTETYDSAAQPGFGDGGFGGGPGSGQWGSDASTPLDSGLTGGGATGGFTGGGTTGGFIAGGFTAGGFIAGGFPGGRLDGGPRDAGTPGPAVDASGSSDAAVIGNGSDPFAELRQVCVDTINMYRATMNLSPISRASATLEACSDQGAQYDGELNRGKPPNQIMGHASTQVPGKGFGGGAGRLCGSPELGAQNTCPGWRVGPGSGNSSLADALKRCLAQMWAEGEPPIGVDACKARYLSREDTSCFLEHGHWINMAAPSGRAVACGFFDMGDNAFWMNQDFVGN